MTFVIRREVSIVSVRLLYEQHPVDRLDLEHHMIGQDIGNGTR